MTDPFRHIVTNGKEARCWHITAWDAGLSGPRTDTYFNECIHCKEWVGTHDYNPTPTLDDLEQRCREEGFDVKLNTYYADGHHCVKLYDSHGALVGECTVSDSADTPKEALTLALARALGWDG